MNKPKLIISVLTILWLVLGMTNAAIINCFYYIPSSNDGAMKPSDIDPTLCTHLSYFHMGIFVPDARFNADEAVISDILALKEKNPYLQVFVVIGDWNGYTWYLKNLEDADKRRAFVSYTLRFLEKYGFDGLDISWTMMSNRTEDKLYFVTLLKELKEELEPLNLKLVFSATKTHETSGTTFDIPNIAKVVDYINVHSTFSTTSKNNVTIYATPLKGQGNNNFEFTVDYWLRQGVPNYKLVMGIPFFGLSFQLSNPQQHTLGSPIAGPGHAGPYFRTGGAMGYNEICTLNNNWTYQWDSEHKVPFLFKADQWVSYENTESIELKVEFGNSLNLAGYLVGPFDADDFTGQCGEKYPLLNAINNKSTNTTTVEGEINYYIRVRPLLWQAALAIASLFNWS